MHKQKIEIVIENPEALDIASERLTKELVNLWWKKNVEIDCNILDMKCLESKNNEGK